MHLQVNPPCYVLFSVQFAKDELLSEVLVVYNVLSLARCHILGIFVDALDLYDKKRKFREEAEDEFLKSVKSTKKNISERAVDVMELVTKHEGTATRSTGPKETFGLKKGGSGIFYLFPNELPVNDFSLRNDF